MRIAADRQQLLAAYRLVFRRYAARGFIRDRTRGIIYSPEFAAGDSRTLVALSPTGHVTGTATLIGQPISGLSPAESVVPWRTILATSGCRRLAGVTCLAVDSGMEAKPSEFFALARFLFQYALNRRYDGLVLAIHPRQLRFYQRICPIVPLGAPYRQAKLANSLAVACRIDLDASSLMRVMPGILSWFETPISLVELNRPGISLVDNSFLTRYADNDDHASPSIGAAGVALAS